MKTTLATQGMSTEKPRIMSKEALKKLRRWSKYHNNVTVYEAFRFLADSSMPVFEREKLHNLNRSQRPIEFFLIDYCGFKKTRIKRNGFWILEKNEPVVRKKPISRNYWDVLRSLAEGEVSI
jgi:hypothetical protein